MKKTLFSVIASNFIGSGLGFLINIMIARLLSVAEYGRINLIFSFVIILFSLFEFNIGNSMVIFYKKFEKIYGKDSKELIFFVNKTFLKFIKLSFLFVAMVLSGLYHFYDLSYLEVVIILINFYMFLLYRYFTTIHQAVGRWKSFNILNILNNVVKSIVFVIVFFTIGYYLDLYNTFLIGYGLFSIIVFIISLMMTWQYLKLPDINFSYKYDRLFNGIIVPLGISNIFILISMRVDNLVIERVLGPEALGIYAAANIMALMFPLITSALRNVFLQKGSGQGVDYLRNIVRQQKKYGLIILGLFVFAFLLAKPVFLLLYGERYIDSILVFQILLVPYIGGVFFTPLESYFYGKEPKRIRNLKFFQMSIIVIFIFLLIFKFGLIGVAIAIAISRIFGWIYLSWRTHQKLSSQ